MKFKKRKIADPGIPKKGIKKGRKSSSKAARYKKQFEKYQKALELYGEDVTEPKYIKKRTIESLKKRWAKIRKLTGDTLRNAYNTYLGKSRSPSPKPPKPDVKTPGGRPATTYDHTDDYDNWTPYETTYDNLLEQLIDLRMRYAESNHLNQDELTRTAVDKVIRKLQQMANEYGKEVVGAAIDKSTSAGSILDTIDTVPYGYEEGYVNNVAEEVATIIDEMLNAYETI